jgi:hypothetical protein
MTTANRTRIIVIALVIAVLALFAYAIYQNSTSTPDYTGVHAPINQRADAIEAYVRANLAELSPVEPSMGGSFYITRIRLLDGAGTVNYEDGHMAYVADFTYTVSENNRDVTVSDFVVRDQ